MGRKVYHQGKERAIINNTTEEIIRTLRPVCSMIPDQSLAGRKEEGRGGGPACREKEYATPYT